MTTRIGQTSFRQQQELPTKDFFKKDQVEALKREKGAEAVRTAFTNRFGKRVGSVLFDKITSKSGQIASSGCRSELVKEPRWLEEFITEESDALTQCGLGDPDVEKAEAAAAQAILNLDDEAWTAESVCRTTAETLNEALRSGLQRTFGRLVGTAMFNNAKAEVEVGCATCTRKLKEEPLWLEDFIHNELRWLDGLRLDANATSAVGIELAEAVLNIREENWSIDEFLAVMDEVLDTSIQSALSRKFGESVGAALFEKLARREIDDIAPFVDAWADKPGWLEELIDRDTKSLARVHRLSNKDLKAIKQGMVHAALGVPPGGKQLIVVAARRAAKAMLSPPSTSPSKRARFAEKNVIDQDNRSRNTMREGRASTPETVLRLRLRNLGDRANKKLSDEVFDQLISELWDRTKDPTGKRFIAEIKANWDRKTDPSGSQLVANIQQARRQNENVRAARGSNVVDPSRRPAGSASEDERTRGRAASLGGWGRDSLSRSTRLPPIKES